jgi:pimeloyl-ACP methyl ester carboxylesterase
MDKSSGAYNLLSNMGTADWNVNYEDISCPVLVVMGLQDRVFYDAEVVTQLMHRIADVQRVDIPHAGHMLPLEVPNDLIRELQLFAADL